MELIDTHCHLTFEPLADDVENVLARSRDTGVTGWITVGTDIQQNHKVIELAERHENMYAAVGFHPHDAKNATDQRLAELRALAQQSQKVVAIGETGLDFHYNYSPQEAQRRVFTEHLKIAAELHLPVIIHCRQAFDETMEILEQYGRVKKAVFHCFSGSAEQAKLVLDRGFYISFTGVVTFKNAEVTRQATKIVPADRLMLETDCPYMSPEPMRKQKINEPALLIHTARCLAKLKEMPLADFAKAVTATTKTVFNLP
jgi:TatD DNase family protein